VGRDKGGLPKMIEICCDVVRESQEGCPVLERGERSFLVFFFPPLLFLFFLFFSLELMKCVRGLRWKCCGGGVASHDECIHM